MRAEVVSCLGSLVQSCCGQGGALQKNVTGMCGEHSLSSGHTGFAPVQGGCVCIPHLHCSVSRLLSREWALCCVDFPGLSCSDSGFQVFHKSTDLVASAFCAFPSRSSSGSQKLDRCTLPGCRAASPLRSPHLSFHAHRSGVPCVPSGKLISGCNPSGGCRPSRISGSLWLEAGSLFAVWRRVVPKFRAFPNLILSLLLSHSLSCYLTLAPFNCPQGIQAWSSP